MKLSDLAALINQRKDQLGDVDCVLWDLDTGGYFALSSENIVVQTMKDGSKRISIGINDWDSARADDLL